MIVREVKVVQKHYLDLVVQTMGIFRSPESPMSSEQVINGIVPNEPETDLYACRKL
jgi:hypothetical protein